MTTTTTRRCETCPTILRRSKPLDIVLCDACSEKEIATAIIRLRAQMAERERRAEEPRPVTGAAVPKYTRETLLETLLEMKDVLGRTPSYDDCRHPWPSMSAFTRVFGRWSAALEEAGIKVTTDGRQGILNLLADGPNTAPEIARLLGRNNNAVSSLLSNMHAEGILDREKVSRGERVRGWVFRYSLIEKGER